MPSRRAEQNALQLVLIVSDILLFILSFVTGQVVCFFGALFLLLFLLFISLYLRIAVRCLYFTRSHSKSAVEGEEFFVEAAVANFSYLPLFCLKVEDSFAPGRSFSIDRTVVETIRARSVFEYTARTWISRKMGTYTIGPARLILTDPFGIFSVSKTVACITDLTVYPSVRVPENLKLMDVPVIKRVGEEVVSYAGCSTDFRGQREYRKEDSKRIIHWRATARRGELTVKEFDEKGVTDIGVYADHRTIALRGTGNVTTLILSLNCAASICAAASSRYHRFSIDFPGHPDVSGVGFGTGMYHLHAVLQSMVALQRPGKYSSYVKQAGQSLHRIKRGGTAVFIFSQTVTDAAGMCGILRKCVSLSIKPVVVLIDDRTFIKLYPEQLEIDREAPHISSARELFESAGAQVYILSKKDVPAEVLNVPSTGALHGDVLKQEKEAV